MYEFEPTYHAFGSKKGAAMDEEEKGQLCTDILSLMFNCSGQYSEEKIDTLIPFRFFTPTSYQVRSRHTQGNRVGDKPR